MIEGQSEPSSHWKFCEQKIVHFVIKSLKREMLYDGGWAPVTVVGKLSAQFEHSVAITENRPLILTLY